MAFIKSPSPLPEQTPPTKQKLDLLLKNGIDLYHLVK